jgi:pyridoxine/pyridoxamine 5'-phosphate oxidase
VHDLSEILDGTWTALADGVAHARDPFHTPTVGTVREGSPVIRTVVLRYLDANEGVIGFNTDRRSPKLVDLETTPELAWHLYDRARKLQIRLRGVSTVHVDDDVADRAWDAVTPLGRRCYGQSLQPGTSSDDPQVPLPSLESLEDGDPLVLAQCRENFSVVRCRVTDIDWLYLEFRGHQRARFTRVESEWQGRWIAP